MAANRLRGLRVPVRSLRCFKDQDKSAYSQFFEIVGPKGIRLLDEIGFSVIPTSSVDYFVQVGGEVSQRKREKTLVVPSFRIGTIHLSPNQLSEGTFKTLTMRSSGDTAKQGLC